MEEGVQMKTTRNIIYLLCAAVILVLSGCTQDNNSGAGSSSSGSATASNLDAIYDAAISDPRRPAEEVQRDAGRKPAEVLKFFGVAPGQRILDLGSGDGYFTRILSGIVGDTGSVIANNSGRRAGEEFQTQYREQYASYGNVELNFETPEEVSLADNSVDMVLLSLAIHHWHYSEDTGEFVPDISLTRYDNIRRILKPGGVFAVIDHAAAEGATRQASDELHRIPSEVVKADLALAGFVLVAESDIHSNHPNDDVTVRWGRDPRDATMRIVHKYIKP
jgi:predicted methyltransferase